MAVLFFVCLILALFLNVVATVLVYRDYRDLFVFSLKEKFKQLLLVWFVPVVGAIIVINRYRRTENAMRKRDNVVPPDERGSNDVLIDSLDID